MQTYSFTKGFWKGTKAALGTALMIATFLGLADVEIWPVVVKYVQPFLGTMTIGGAIVFVINLVKFHTSE